MQVFSSGDTACRRDAAVRTDADAEVIAGANCSSAALMQAACCAVKRINMDIRTAKTAQKAGADLKEKFEASASCAGRDVQTG